MSLIGAFSKTSVFGPCRPEWLQELASSTQVREGRRGEVLVEQYQRFPYIGLVCDGVIGVTLHTNGGGRGVHRLRLYESHPGDTFAEIGFVGSNIPLGEISIVSRRATYALVPSELIANESVHDPALFGRIAAQAAERAHDLAKRMVEHQSRPVGARLAGVLLRYASGTEGMQPADPQLSDFTQRDIAAAAGCVKEAAARAIGDLEDAGALRREHGHIRYLDRGVLLKYKENSDCHERRNDRGSHRPSS